MAKMPIVPNCECFYGDRPSEACQDFPTYILDKYGTLGTKFDKGAV